jgi:hypothetical protein
VVEGRAVAGAILGAAAAEVVLPEVGVSSPETEGSTLPPMRANVSSHAAATPPINPSFPTTESRYLNKSPTKN